MVKNKLGGSLSALAIWSLGGMPRSVRFVPDGDGASGGETPEAKAEREAAEKKAENDRLEKDKAGKIYTKKDVDAAAANARREADQKHLDKVNSLLADKELSDKARKDLEARREELEGSLLTEKQQATKDKEKLTAEYDKKLKASQEKELFWTSKFQQTETRRQIRDACYDLEAKDPDQIFDMVMPKVKLIEEKDDKLNSTGDWILAIEVTETVDDNGKQKKVKQMVSIDEYIKAMSENEKYDNLFRSSRVGGSGTRPSGGGRGSADGLPQTSAAKITRGLAGLKR